MGFFLFLPSPSILELVVLGMAEKGHGQQLASIDLGGAAREGVRRDCRAEMPRAAAGGWLKRQYGLGRHGFVGAAGLGFGSPVWVCWLG
jgi:hypothetical protein